jgi:hypothetical protein
MRDALRDAVSSSKPVRVERRNDKKQRPRRRRTNQRG